MSAEALGRLESAYQQTLIRLAAGQEMAAETRWLRLPGLSADDVAVLIDDLGRTGAAARQAAARLAAAFVDQYVATSGGPQGLPPVDIDAAIAEVRGGAQWDQIIDEPLKRARGLADAGLGEALTETAPMLGRIADQDVVLAARAGTMAAAERHDIRMWARRPEPTACSFCRTAAEQRYHTPDLRPIHPHCHCIVVPLVGDAAAPGATTRRAPRRSALTLSV